ncbi:MAG TPA: DUF3634 family protein [Polyangiaceae bacterium]|nr:DUF3634 family protein [Polyangiaceae bacterium]
MNFWIGIVCILIFLVGVLWAARRANELFVLRIREGRVQHVRGRMPPALYEAMREVAASPVIRNARVRGVVERGNPRLRVSGDVPPDQEQRLRNVLGMFPLPRIRAGRRAP